MFFMMLTLRHMLISALVIMVMASPASAEQRLEDSTRLIETLVERIQNLVTSEPTPDKIRAETNDIINKFFDYDTVARFAAGQSWRTATDQQKADYKTAFREVLLSLAETQFQQFRTLEYTSLNAIPKGKKLVVATGKVHDVSGKLPDSIVSWRVSTPPGQAPRIIDIEVENISMLITQQQENTAIIRQNGGRFQALIDALTERAENIKEAK
jgi:phospholipid transport system substrate-binding protein